MESLGEVLIDKHYKIKTMNRRNFFRKAGVGTAIVVATPVIGADLILDMERVAIEKEKQSLGVLCIPEDCIPDGMTTQDIIDMWTQSGSIVYNAKGKSPYIIPANDFLIFE